MIGAGVGGWVMLHSAQMKPDSVLGLVGVAADPDFTETLVWPALDEETKAKVSVCLRASEEARECGVHSVISVKVCVNMSVCVCART